MAKKKKLTVEEKLVEALVREDEQPYEVPGNWVWTTIRNIGRSVTGTTPSKKNELFYGEEYPFFKPTDLEQGYFVEHAREYLSKEGIDKGRFIPKYSTLVTCIGATIGKCGFSRIDGSANQQINAILPYDNMNNKYIYWFINTPFLQDCIKTNSSSTTLPILNKSRFEVLKFPLPPLAEQQRIVDRIESLFDQLDQAKALIQEALDSFETRKAAIIHQAFTGALTKKWREEHGVGLESWVKYTLSEICTLKSGTTIPLEEELSIGKIPYIKVAEMNLEENQFSITTSIRYVNECAESKLIPLGSIIFPKRGGAIFTNKKRILLNTPIIADLNIMAIIPDKNYLTSLYAYFWFLTVNLKELNNGSNVPQINNKDMVNLIIPTPSILEQQEIVRILDDLFEKEQAAQDLCDQIDQIDTIKKTILGKAFRGELGTNVAGEESAMELLKKVLTKVS